MKYMQLQDFYQTGLPPEEFSKWSSKWNAQHDPRAFGWDHLTVQQRKDVLKTVKNPALFKQDVTSADEAGVLTKQ